MANRLFSAMRRTTAAMRTYSPMGATRVIQAAMARSGVSAMNVWLAQNHASPARSPAPGPETDPVNRQRPASPDLTADGTFTTRSFRCKEGLRDYKLFIPREHAAAPRGLVVMLHGCTQNPDDFAAGTRMNAVAARNGLIVAYPAQTRAHNASSCWNWFQTGDQHRDKGEPAVLAGIARELMAESGLMREQVFVAGLSAGGAMAVIMAETYPDVFAAVGVHSGLPYQSANNVMSALTAMRGRAVDQGHGGAHNENDRPAMRTIVFHGSADKTVHPSNAEGIANKASPSTSDGTTVVENGNTNNRSFTRTVISDADGQVLVENWTIAGAGHAWSGGSRTGTFADPLGPDASAEMVRFFLVEQMKADCRTQLSPNAPRSG